MEYQRRPFEIQPRDYQAGEAACSYNTVVTGPAHAKGALFFASRAPLDRLPPARNAAAEHAAAVHGFDRKKRPLVSGPLVGRGRSRYRRDQGDVVEDRFIVPKST